MRFDLFKTFSLTWWQLGILKLSLLSAGIAVGAYWATAWLPYIPVLIGLTVVTALYFWYVWAKQ